MENSVNIVYGGVCLLCTLSSISISHIHKQEASRQEVVHLQRGEGDGVCVWKVIVEKSREEFRQVYDLLKVWVMFMAIHTCTYFHAHTHTHPYPGEPYGARGELLQPPPT